MAVTSEKTSPDMMQPPRPVLPSIPQDAPLETTSLPPMPNALTSCSPVKVVPIENKLDEFNVKTWMKDGSLSVVVLGASGDLATNKTYPALFRLWKEGLIPRDTHIFGYGQSPLRTVELRKRLKPILLENVYHNEASVQVFLMRCTYSLGSSYDDVAAFTELAQQVQASEDAKVRCELHHRLFYLCVPPTIQQQAAMSIKHTCMQEDDKGWSRIILEKPFGKDLNSFEALQNNLSQSFHEDHLYRMDHYLGKEIVQNLSVLRFANRWLERIWNRDNVKCVIITFKEKQGTTGDDRGAYFDEYGIVRDVVQNHLLQVLSLLAMDTPLALEGEQAIKAVRDAKLSVLNAIGPITKEDVMIGQYEGYHNDPNIENKSSTTPTFCALRCYIHNRKWAGVPFILKAGKGLNEDKVEFRIQFKDSGYGETMFNGVKCPRNEFGTCCRESRSMCHFESVC